MVKRLKTVEYVFPILTFLVNNTPTNLEQITLYIPESGVVFKSVVAELTCADIVTATGGTVTTRSIGLQLGAGSYTTINNTSTATNSGNNIWWWHTANFTSLFQSDWTGTSMTCNADITINQTTGSTLGMADLCLKLIIMYEYEDSSGTQLKTIRWPLNSPTSGLYPTTGVYGTQQFDTVPALSTALSESGVVIRDCFLEIQGNTASASNAADFYFSGSIGATGFQSSSIEHAIYSDRYYRYIWKAFTGAVVFDTSSSQPFTLGCSVSGKMSHPASTLHVTYEFNASGSTTILNSIMLPYKFDGYQGKIVDSDRQKTTTSFYIEEPAPITVTGSAIYAMWDTYGTIAAFNFKVSGQNYIPYANIGDVVAGPYTLQRTFTGIAFNRGLNTLSAESYTTNSTLTACNLCGYWMLNYYSAKHPSGVGVHNNTNIYNVASINATSAAQYLITGDITIPKPSGDYYINSNGVSYMHWTTNAFNSPNGYCVQVQRTSGEGGPKWETMHETISSHDNDTAARYSIGANKTVFKRYELDNHPDRLDPFITRRWKLTVGHENISSYKHLDYIYTIHGITHSITGTIVGYTGNGSNVVLDFYRASDHEHLFTITGATSGQVNTTWFDDTEQYYLTAKQGSYAGRSLDSTV